MVQSGIFSHEKFGPPSRMTFFGFIHCVPLHCVPLNFWIISLNSFALFSIVLRLCVCITCLMINAACQLDLMYSGSEFKVSCDEMTMKNAQKICIECILLKIQKIIIENSNVILRSAFGFSVS